MGQDNDSLISDEKMKKASKQNLSDVGIKMASSRAMTSTHCQYYPIIVWIFEIKQLEHNDEVFHHHHQHMWVKWTIVMPALLHLKKNYFVSKTLELTAGLFFFQQLDIS